MYDGDTCGTKRFSAEDILRLAATNHTAADIKELYSANLQASSQQAVRFEQAQMRLLEKSGLTHVENPDDFYQHLTGLAWRIGSQIQINIPRSQSEEPSSSPAPSGAVLSGDHHSFSSDNNNEDDYIRRKEEEEDLENEDRKPSTPEVIRCPHCTLKVPCKHFFTIKSVKEYHDKKKQGKLSYQHQSKKEIIASGSLSSAQIQAKYKKKELAMKTEQILSEVGIDDRDTDRTLIYVEKYGSNRSGEKAILNGANNGTEEIAQEGIVTIQSPDEKAVDITPSPPGLYAIHCNPLSFPHFHISLYFPILLFLYCYSDVQNLPMKNHY